MELFEKVVFLEDLYNSQGITKKLMDKALALYKKREEKGGSTTTFCLSLCHFRHDCRKIPSNKVTDFMKCYRDFLSRLNPSEVK